MEKAAPMNVVRSCMSRFKFDGSIDEAQRNLFPLQAQTYFRIIML